VDPLAHTLVGACLGEAGLKHRSRLAMPTLLLGANLPDVDAIATLFGRDCMYDFRRGWTHGVFGMLLGCTSSGFQF
jgi:inner membrane protein